MSMIIYHGRIKHYARTGFAIVLSQIADKPDVDRLVLGLDESEKRFSIIAIY